MRGVVSGLAAPLRSIDQRTDMPAVLRVARSHDLHPKRSDRRAPAGPDQYSGRVSTRGLGCAASLVAGVLLVIVTAGWLLTTFGRSVTGFFRDDVSLSVAYAPSVAVGDVVRLDITMDNGEPHEVDGMLYVDLDGGLYRGFEPAASTPAWFYAFDDEVRGRHRLAYELALRPGPNRYLLELRAHTVGQWQGRIHYYRATSRHPLGPPPVVSIRVDGVATP